MQGSCQVNSSSYYQAGKDTVFYLKPGDSEKQGERTCQVSRFIKTIFKMVWCQLRDRKLDQHHTTGTRSKFATPGRMIDHGWHCRLPAKENTLP